MKLLIEVLNHAIAQLEANNVPHARRQAEELIAAALHLSRIQLYMQSDKPLTEEEQQHCRAKIARRIAHEPLAYILGNTPFHDCTIKVNPSVLIPRVETEYLVDCIIKDLEKQDLKGKTVWDICTGSGCIGIALKRHFPQLTVILSDISSEAIAVAEENADLNQVEVIFRTGDLLAPFKGEKADFVICNPPYIAENEFSYLEPEVRDFEPKRALVGKNEGLDFYQRLDKELPDYLNKPAKVWVEIGSTQGESVKNIFKNPSWKTVCLHQDLSSHDRFFSLENE